MSNSWEEPSEAVIIILVGITSNYGQWLPHVESCLLIGSAMPRLVGVAQQRLRRTDLPTKDSSASIQSHHLLWAGLSRPSTFVLLLQSLSQDHPSVATTVDADK